LSAIHETIFYLTTIVRPTRTRGVSKAEDDEEYQRNQQKKKEKWAARDEEIAERDEESLREFRPSSTNELPSISLKEARALRLKIQRLREQLLEIKTNSAETENNVESIAFRAKHLLKRFYPHSSFRIHSHEMGARGDLLVRRRMSELRRRLEDEFEVVLNHLESVIDR